MPTEVEHWSLPTLRQKLVKIGAKFVRHGRYVTIQLAEVAVPRNLFREIYGGSIYWIIMGCIRARQRIVGIDRTTNTNGVNF